MDWSQLPTDNPWAVTKEVLRILRTSDQPWKGIESVELDLARHLIDLFWHEIYTAKDEAYGEACGECIRVLGKHHRLLVMDWFQLPTGDSWEPAVMRILQRADEPWRGIQLVEPDDIPKLMNFLQKGASTSDDETYRKSCTRCLQVLQDDLPFEWRNLPSDKPWTLIRAALRILQTYSQAWNDIESVPSEAAQALMDFLQDELDTGVFKERYRMTYFKCLRVLGNHHHIMPSSFFLWNVKRDGEDRPVAGGGAADIWKGAVEGKTVCLKVLREFTTDTSKKPQQILKNFCREALIWRQLCHPNVLPFLGVNKDLFAPRLCMISPWMEHKDILSFLKENPSHDRLRAIHDIAQGIQYLHELDPPIVHGDIRGANVLVDNDQHCCVAGFGLSMVADSAEAFDEDSILQGSLRWMPPEALDYSRFKSSYVTAKDIYSFGYTILEIYTGKPPFSHIASDMAAMREILIRNEKPPRPSLDVLSSDELWALVMSCLSTSAEDRPSAAAIVDTLRGILGMLVSEAADSKYLEAPIPASVTASVGASSTPESSNCTLSARPILPIHVHQHLLLRQDAIYELFDHKVGLSKDHVLLTAAFDEDALSLNDISLAGDFAAAECAHIFCDTDFAVEDSNQADGLRQLLLDVGKELSPHLGILQTPSYKFRTCSASSSTSGGTSGTGVSFSLSTSSNRGSSVSREVDGHENPDPGPPTDTPRCPNPNQSPAAGDPTLNAETPTPTLTGSGGQPGAMPEPDPDPSAGSAEESRRVLFMVRFKFDKNSPLLLDQDVVVEGSIGTMKISNSPEEDVVSSSRVEFFRLDFQSTPRGTQTPAFCYDQFYSCVAIHTPHDYPNVLSNERPLPSQVSVDGSVKLTETTEESQATQFNATVKIGMSPSADLGGTHNIANKAAHAKEVIQKVIRIQRFKTWRRGLRWEYHINDRYSRADGLQLTQRPDLLPLVDFAFRGRNKAQIPPDKLDIAVLSFWELPEPSSRTHRGWRKFWRLDNQEPKIPIRNFGVKVHLEVPTHLEMGSVVEKDVDVGSDYVDDNPTRLKQSVTDYDGVGDLETTLSAYAVSQFKAKSFLDS